MNNKETKREIFKRRIFYQICDWIRKSDKRFLILTGPMLCGKSVCMLQIAREFHLEHNIYNMGVVGDEYDRVKIIEEIILPATDGIFLLDNITLLPFYLNYLSKINESIRDNLDKGIEDRRRIIVTGNNPYQIHEGAKYYLGEAADYLQTSFIDFEEWVAYRKRVRRPNNYYYRDYLLNCSKFHWMNGKDSILVYMDSCLLEACLSNHSLLCDIYGTVGISELSNYELYNALYFVLIHWHNKDVIREEREQDYSLDRAIAFLEQWGIIHPMFYADIMREGSIEECDSEGV